MSAVAHALLSAWLLLPHPHGDTEDDAARYVRLATTAAAVEAETRTDTDAAIVAATIEHESQSFSLSVHDGTRLGDHRRAYCLGQLHAQRWLPPVELARTVGTDVEATRRCIRGVVAAYVHIRCATLEAELNTYATGKGCASTWEGTPERAARVKYYLDTIRHERKQSNEPKGKA